MRIKHALVLCPKCKGKGHTRTPRTPDAHGSLITCQTCEGDRVMQEITSVEYLRVNEGNAA